MSFLGAFAWSALFLCAAFSLPLGSVFPTRTGLIELSLGTGTFLKPPPPRVAQVASAVGTVGGLTLVDVSADFPRLTLWNSAHQKTNISI